VHIGRHFVARFRASGLAPETGPQKIRFLGRSDHTGRGADLNPAVGDPSPHIGREDGPFCLDRRKAGSRGSLHGYASQSVAMVPEAEQRGNSET
jgi:hypothetical protein